MRFEHLTVLREFKLGRFLMWECACDCGTTKVIRRSHVKDGLTKSCGCYRKSLKAFKTHGMSRTKTYTVWMGMLNRCRNKNEPSYAQYGSRGIKVCERWMAFENFLDDMGERPAGLSLERINVDGNYEPGNCRWATALEQARNRRTTLNITINGVTRCLKEWAITLGLNYKALHRAHRRGSDIEAQLRTTLEARR